MEIEMDWNRVEGNWKQVKGKIKEQWGRPTDDDLNVMVAATNLRVKSKSGTATIRFVRKWTIGTPRKDGNRDLSLTSIKGRGCRRLSCKPVVSGW
jgi:hypothetical protein